MFIAPLCRSCPPGTRWGPLRGPCVAGKSNFRSNDDVAFLFITDCAVKSIETSVTRNAYKCPRKNRTINACAASNRLRCSLQTMYVKKNEKALREPQTLRAGCSKAEPKMFVPPQTPFPRAQDRQNLSAGDGHYLHLQTKFGEDRCTQF